MLWEQFIRPSLKAMRTPLTRPLQGYGNTASLSYPDTWVRKPDYLHFPYTHTMKYYSALDERGNPSICDNLVGIMLSEISQTEKDKYYMVSLRTTYLKNVKLVETESRTLVAWDLGVGEMGKGWSKL